MVDKEHNERLDEINFAVDLIETICKGANILLVAQEKNGLKYVGVHDSLDGKDYCLVKPK